MWRQFKEGFAPSNFVSFPWNLIHNLCKQIRLKILKIYGLDSKEQIQTRLEVNNSLLRIVHYMFLHLNTPLVKSLQFFRRMGSRKDRWRLSISHRREWVSKNHKIFILLLCRLRKVMIGSNQMDQCSHSPQNSNKCQLWVTNRNSWAKIRMINNKNKNYNRQRGKDYWKRQITLIIQKKIGNKCSLRQTDWLADILNHQAFLT